MNEKLDIPTELSEEQELSLEKNIVWVFGPVRGGTTWLGSQLLSYQTYTMFEPKITRLIGDWRQWIVQNGKKIDRQGAQKDYIFSLQYKKTWIYHLRKLILNRIYSQFPDFSKKIILKEPLGKGGSDIMSECLPNSKIIIIVRDGRDIIDSRLDAVRDQNSWGVKQEGNKPMAEDRKMTFIRNNSIQYVTLIEDLMSMHSNHDKKLRIMVRYEDLRNNTVEELSKIYQFLGIDIARNKLEEIVEKYSFENIPSQSKGKGKFNRYATPGKWKENFNEEEKKLMKSIMENTLKKLNYEI